jgi:membrane-bound lytic murein transglycosylase D
MIIKKILLNQNTLSLVFFSLLSSCSFNSKRSVEFSATNPDQKDIDAELVENTPKELDLPIHSHSLNSEEIRSYEESKRTFPLVHNENVQVWIDYFTGRGRRTMEKWLARSTRYIPIIKKVLKEDGLPPDLIYLSMIESGFNPRAYSHAAAVGPWQFIKGTGTRYGLKVNYWIDERKDIIKSTHAAAKYLKELYQVFGSWYLAAAGYNAGEGRVINAIRRDRSRNFWELIQNKVNFRAETRNYVPKIIAAALISKHPEQYGFTKSITYEKPLTWESVRVPGGVDLRSVAKATGTSHQRIKLLNSELRIGITPPDAKNGYLLKIEPHKKDLLVSKLSELKSMQINYFVNHRLKRGENLGYIARRYKTKVSTLMQLNAIRNARRLQIGQTIKVPLPGSKFRRNSKGTLISTNNHNGTHVVKRGETLSGIATAYKTKVSTLMKLNKIRSARSLKVGTKLKIPGASSGTAYHTVKRGESLSKIAEKYGTNYRTIMKLNGLRSTRNLSVGKKLRLPAGAINTSSSKSKKMASFHIVKRGETLEKIARLYKTSIKNLMSLNGIKNASSLQAGARLRLKAKSASKKKIAAKYISHRVKRGENLTLIAKKYKTEISTIVKINDLKNSRLLRVGQNLKVPNPFSMPGI